MLRADPQTPYSTMLNLAFRSAIYRMHSATDAKQDSAIVEISDQKN